MLTTGTQAQRPKAKNTIFRFRKLHNVKIQKNLNFKNLTLKEYFFYHYMGKRKY